MASNSIMPSTIRHICFFCTFIMASSAFNLDAENPIYMVGPSESWFGFSLAAHFRPNGPSLLIGAPHAYSGQPGTFQSGAVFSCEFDNANAWSKKQNCVQLHIEYPQGSEEAQRPPKYLHSKILHPEGKNHQLLGFTVQSTGLIDQTSSRALACAPLLRWGQNAYTDGICYLLNAELDHTGMINSCGPLPKKDRHNDYGACENGFSAFIDKNVILTGLPGARKWTGGIFAKYEFVDEDGFPDSVDRWTMEVDKEQNGILPLLSSHDYIGYSVRYGRFGFWHEDEQNFTIVSGATRYNQTGAVFFLPFRRNFQAEEQHQLGLFDDKFLLVGRQLGSGFGASIEVLDLNGDGFDDLLIGAPFEYLQKENTNMGGAVYIFYSRGAKQRKNDNNLVFLRPIVLRGHTAHSQFGAALAKLGNLDNDPHGYQDFCVGAPQEDFGRGAIFIFYGADPAHLSLMPTQQIRAKDFNEQKMVLKSFGAALSGAIDFDGDGYAELAVGAPNSDTAILFRANPVFDVQLSHRFSQKYVKILNDRNKECVQGQSCFFLTTLLFTSDRNHSSELLNLISQSIAHPFICHLAVISFAKGLSGRAFFSINGANQISWPCGAKSIGQNEEQTHKLHIPKGNQDWTNPLRFNFSIAVNRLDSIKRPTPVVNPEKKIHLFQIAFDKDCGEDNECHTDLVLSGTMLDLTRRANGLYVAKVTERDVLVLRLHIENRAELAYLAKLYLEYDENELDEPNLVPRSHRKNSAKNDIHQQLDIERRERGRVVVTLGNPMEARKKLSFDLLFKLVRGSSERISTSLHFKAIVNSSSFEYQLDDNRWEAQVQLIKEADLQLAGISRPLIVHFSRGNVQPSDEQDIGPQVVHSYMLTNNGPFYAQNVTVKIDWPLRLNSPFAKSDWLLYTLEEPLVRQNGKARRCQINLSSTNGIIDTLINPLGIYNDETLKLDYPLKRKFGIFRPGRSKRMIEEIKRQSTHKQMLITRANSILHPGGKLLPKLIQENSGEWVRVVDINCKEGKVHCTQLMCHFDYIGSNDSAIVEIRARFWNWTFSAEDYRIFDYIAISSEGFIEIDPAQGILEDVSNNFASVSTHAYPDRPHQEDRIQLWLLILSALIGFLLFALLVLFCWRFGFFQRKRPGDPHLHQAHYTHQREESLIITE